MWVIQSKMCLHQLSSPSLMSVEGVPGGKWWKTRATNGYFKPCRTSSVAWPHAINKMCVSSCNCILSLLMTMFSFWIPGGKAGLGSVVGGSGRLAGPGYILALAELPDHRFFQPLGTALQQYLVQAFAERISGSCDRGSFCVRDTNELPPSLWGNIREMETLKQSACACWTRSFSNLLAVALRCHEAHRPPAWLVFWPDMLNLAMNTIWVRRLGTGN